MPVAASWFKIAGAALCVAIFVVAAVLPRPGALTLPLPHSDVVSVDVPERADTCRIEPLWHGRRTAGVPVSFIPPGSTTPAAARAIALAGEQLAVVRRQLLVNGRPLATTSKCPTPVANAEAVIVPRGCAYLLVDGRTGEDSYVHGPVPYWRILGELKR